ncbi:probable flavin-containing monooxygenase 1 isoform X2 [Oryza brachyantha]|nr:probable flavin-containing monooxygenase 1 isoform X2 [Oryza brachyantha]
MEETKRVAIVGAGASGLAACKHALERGFRPVVFEADAAGAVGGVWARTIASTRLQTPRPYFEFSDFPWPPAVADLYPDHDQVAGYLRSYAERFGVLECVRFGCRVASMEYAGAGEEEVMAWEHWAGNGEAFGTGRGEWRLTVQHGDSVELHVTDFVVLCIGRFSGASNMPRFPPDKGPEAFAGTAIHSMEYANMGAASATQLVKAKLVTVVGYQKSAVDIAAEIADANGASHPCTIVLRKKRWIVPDLYAWGVPIAVFFITRFSQLLLHKPGNGLILSLVATLLSPLRWFFSKFVESYYKWALPMEKHDMVPDEGFLEGMCSCSVTKLPHKFYDKVEEGSIVLKKAKRFSFCKEGLIIEGDSSSETIKSDVVIFATGFNGDQKIREMFKSPLFRDIVAGSPSGIVPHFRQCIHPRIPQLAIIGYAESWSNLCLSELLSKWLAHLLHGSFRLPSIREMEEDIAEWDKYMKRYAPDRFRRSCVGPVSVLCTDRICQDIAGVQRRRKRWLLADWFVPYGPADYADLNLNSCKL